MEQNKLIVGILLVVLVLVAIYWLSIDKTVADIPDTTIIEPTPVAAAPPGPASDSIIIKKIAPENASDALLSGEIDYYLSSITPEEAVLLRENSDVKLYYASSQVNGVVLNPAPAPEGELNPFSLQKVRFALQYLIDRDAIVEEVYGGFSNPIFINLIQEHPSYDLVKDAFEGLGISHDKEKADVMITEAMEAAGAEKIDGIWTYEGNDVTIKVLDWYPDEEDTLIKLVSLDLESVGFKVEAIPLERGSASPITESQPTENLWNIYSSGWIYYGFSKYEEVAFFGIYSKEGWWEYNSSWEAVADKLANISSEAEWIELNKEIAKLGINDSVGIWLASKNNIFAVGSDVDGLTEDKFIGLRSYGNIRNAKIPGKDTLVVAKEYTYEAGDSWNPYIIEGINMMDIVNTIQDPITWSDPVTLEEGPFRADYSIETNGPNSMMEVPSTTFTWDNDTDQWVTVGDGAIAKTKVTFDLSNYIGANWHHGVPITWADILYNLASNWDMSFDVAKKELSLDRSDTFDLIEGLRIKGDKLEVYLNIWSFDDDDLLILDSTFQRLTPWELYASMNERVFETGDYVYSEYYMPEDSNATQFVLVNNTHVQDVLTTLDGLNLSKIESFMIAGKTYVTEEDLTERSAALNAWAGEYNHLIIGNGPFYLVSFDSEDSSLELKAFRDETYPL